MTNTLFSQSFYEWMIEWKHPCRRKKSEGEKKGGKTVAVRRGTLCGIEQVRSSKQDQIHNSIVSTLLALMDGLDSRGQVVIIGATNRIDALDAALRRPGRSFPPPLS